ncbi:MAG TPA: hypothetical protein VNM92_03515 [Thermoanaerobaculia bacterium]|nr:hypothetical protein [Thermoanaerobaculia bacterium]
MPLAPSLIAFVKPLYQDLDGRSRFEDTERIAAIARHLYEPPSEGDRREMELLLLFEGLGDWLKKLGNVSRTLLAMGPLLEATELRRVIASLGRLDAPATPAEVALACARVIDASGVRALMQRTSVARREGSTPDQVVMEIAAESLHIPDWMPPKAGSMVTERFMKRLEVCREILEEGSGVVPSPDDAARPM